MFPGPKRDPGNDRGTDRNRRVSSPLSPIFFLFLAPLGTLYQRVQRLLAEEVTAEGSSPPVVIKHRRPGPKHPAYGLPTSYWPTVVQRVMEQKEPLRTVAAAYGVSPETIRRLLLHAQKPHGQQEAQRYTSWPQSLKAGCPLPWAVCHRDSVPCGSSGTPVAQGP